VRRDQRRRYSGLTETGLTTFVQQKSQTLPPKKSQTAVLGHIHIKDAKPNTKYTVKLVTNIAIIQFQSLEAFSFSVITLT